MTEVAVFFVGYLALGFGLLKYSLSGRRLELAKVKVRTSGPKRVI